MPRTRAIFPALKHVSFRPKAIATPILLWLLLATTSAFAQTLSLSPSDWTLYSPWGGRAVSQASENGIRFLGSGSRQGTQAISSETRDFRGTTTYIRWRAHGPKGYYSVWGVGIGWRNISSNQSYSVHAGAAVGWTIPKRGTGFSTDHSYLDSKVIDDDVWYYTRIRVSTSKEVTAVTATGGYDDDGGKVFHSHSYVPSEEDWLMLSQASLMASFHDNYGGTGARLEIAEASAVQNPNELVFRVTTEGRRLDLSWTAVPGATGYRLYYAFPDARGDVDMSTLGAIDVGDVRSASYELTDGLVLHGAVMAMRDGSGIALSNIERFAIFDRTVQFPAAGDILMDVLDSEGVLTASFVGTEVSGVPSLPIRSMSIATDEGEMRGTLDDKGRPLTLAHGGIELSYSHGDDGSILYEYWRNGAVISSGPLTEANAASNRVTRMEQADVPGLCQQYPTRESYEAALDQSDEAQEFRSNARMALFFSIGMRGVQGLVVSSTGKTEHRNAIMAHEAHLAMQREFLYQVWVWETLKNERLAQWDRECGEQPTWRFFDWRSYDCDNAAVTNGNPAGVNQIACRVDDRLDLKIAVFEDIEEANSTFARFRTLMQDRCATKPDRSCTRASSLEAYSNEEVWIETYIVTFSSHPSETRYNVIGLLGNALITVGQYYLSSSEERPRSRSEDVYRHGRSLVIERWADTD